MVASLKDDSTRDEGPERPMFDDTVLKHTRNNSPSVVGKREEIPESSEVISP